MFKKFTWLLSLVALLSFNNCGGGSKEEAKELLQRLLQLVGIPYSIVVNICQDDNSNGFCESTESQVKITVNKGDSAKAIFHKITETSEGKYLLETYDPTKPILLELQDAGKIDFNDGKFTLNFNGFKSKDDNSTKELSILESMVDANAITVTEADKFRTLSNPDAQDKFYETLLSTLTTNINTLQTYNLGTQIAVEVTIQEMGSDIKTNQAQADAINNCENNQTCEEEENTKVYDVLIIDEDRAKTLQDEETKKTKELLAGKTFYTEDENSIKTVEINQDATQITFIKTDGTKKIYHTEIKGNAITDEDGIHYIDNVTDKYILGHDEHGQWKFYFNLKDAKKALESSDANGGNDSSDSSLKDLKFTTEYLNGKTLYDVSKDYDDKNNNGNTDEFTVSTLKFSSSSMNYQAGIVDNPKKSVNYTINNKGYLILTYEGEESGVRILNKDSNKLTVCWSDRINELDDDTCWGGEEYFYFDKSKAQAAL